GVCSVLSWLGQKESYWKDKIMKMACLLVFLLSEDRGLREAAKGPPVNAEPEKLVVRMTDPKASFKDRCAAEDELAKLSPPAVLPKLLPRLAKGMPAGGIYNSLGNRDMDRKAPVPWQI